MSDKTLTLSLARLPRALGSTLHEDIVWRAPDDLGTPSMAVAPGTPLDVSVDLTSVEDGVLVQVAPPWTWWASACDASMRCAITTTCPARRCTSSPARPR